MKKISLSIIVLLIASLVALKGLGLYVDSQLDKAQKKYSQSIQQDFAAGITLEEAKEIFQKYGASFNTLECGDGGYNDTSCPDTFRTSMNFPIEGNVITGAGHANAYLYFNEKGEIVGHELLVDYSRYH